MKITHRLSYILSGSSLLFLQGLSFSAQAACPVGTSTVDFTWDGAGTGSEAVWSYNDSSNTYTVNYTDTSGNPASVDVTMSLRDPAKLNFDADLNDIGNHPYDPQGGCAPSDGATVDDWPGDGSIADPWDSDCYGDASTFSTGTQKAYGAGFLSWFIKSAEHTDEVFFDFRFSRPAWLMDNFTIGDIDVVGLGWDYDQHLNNSQSINELPGDSFQDEVGFSAALDGNDVPISIFNAGSALTVSGQTAKAIYNYNQNNNVAPTDPVGTISAKALSPIDTFSIMYSNADDDAAAEQANPGLYSWWSDTHGATNGASDSQAVRVSGFTFCMTLPSKDFGDLPNAIYPTTSSNNGASHLIQPDLYLGSCVDDEADGQSSTDASGDDAAAAGITYGSCATAGEDEDSLTPPTLMDGQSAPQLTIATHNETGVDATLACWVDYNGDGSFSDTTERAEIIVPDNATSVVLTLPDVPTDAYADTGGNSFMRCRLASDPAEIASITGEAASGEVEDYPVTINGVVDLELTKVIDKSTAKRGETVVYTITVFNNGSANATGIKVEEVLPNSLTYVSDSPQQGSYDLGTGVWDVGSLPAGQSLTLGITVTVK